MPVSSLMPILTRITERGLMPDRLTRIGIRSLLQDRLASLPPEPLSGKYLKKFVRAMDRSDIAIHTHDANQQHYEIPAEYFDLVLGPHKKYSCCYWDQHTNHLVDAEENALRTCCERAAIANGQQILELGCGWGSLSLWIAEHYPESQVTAVSNSVSQKNWILAQCAARGLQNVQVITADIIGFAIDEHFDRVLSVEMFEHTRNWRRLFDKVSGWLKADGQFFMHVFCHHRSPYFYELDGDNDWMTRYFFRGGLMPSAALPEKFQDSLRLREKWSWNGEHYAKTLRAWLQRHDAQKAQILGLFSDVYGDEADIWFVRWRLFYLACEELFRYNKGEEWFVGHYLFDKAVAHHA